MSYSLIAIVSAVTLGMVAVVGFFFLKSFGRALEIGEDMLIDRTGDVREALTPEGMVYVSGEYWTACSRSGAQIEEGESIQVTDRDGQTLVVEPIADDGR